MQGKHEYQPELFSYVEIEKVIPPAHLLRRIDKVLDLSFVRQLTASLYCGDNGRPSIDPELYFRMQLIGHIYGIQSDRQLCDEIQVNIAYRWFARLSLQDSIPDHSSLTRIRDRLGEKTFEEIFSRVVKQCMKAGLVPGKRIIVDATLIEANASTEAMVERKKDEGGPGEPERKRHKAYYTSDGRVKKPKRSNQTHVSPSDPESNLVARSGTKGRLCYKAHYSIDSKFRVITDCKVTTGNVQDCVMLPKRLKYLRKKLGFRIEEVLADGGYGVGGNYAYLSENGIRAYIPLITSKTGIASKLEFEGFKYDSRKDRYRCPQSHFLYPYDGKYNGGTSRIFRVTGRHCLTCPMKITCPAKGTRTGNRIISRSEHHELFERIQARRKTPHFRRKLHERSWKIEGLFGEAKLNHKLRRAQYRGVAKVQIQVYLTATVQNLKRLAHKVGDGIRRELKRLFLEEIIVLRFA